MNQSSSNSKSRTAHHHCHSKIHQMQTCLLIIVPMISPKKTFSINIDVSHCQSIPKFMNISILNNPGYQGTPTSGSASQPDPPPAAGGGTIPTPRCRRCRCCRSPPAAEKLAPDPVASWATDDSCQVGGS